jgi:hypothetical protein
LVRRKSIAYHVVVKDPYRAPMPQPAPPRDAMRPILFVTGAIAALIALGAIGVGVWDARAKTREAGPSSTPTAKETPIEREPARKEDFPFVPETSSVPSDFELVYESPNSMIPSFTVTIDARGTATMRYVGEEGVIATVAPMVVLDLWRLVSGHQFFRWHSNLTNDHRGMTDHFPMGLTATANGNHNSITCLDECPTGTHEIVKLVIDSTQPYDWVIGKKRGLLKRR